MKRIMIGLGIFISCHAMHQSLEDGQHIMFGHRHMSFKRIMGLGVRVARIPVTFANDLGIGAEVDQSSCCFLVPSLKTIHARTIGEGAREKFFAKIQAFRTMRQLKRALSLNSLANKKGKKSLLAVLRDIQEFLDTDPRGSVVLEIENRASLEDILSDIAAIGFSKDVVR